MCPQLLWYQGNSFRNLKYIVLGFVKYAILGVTYGLTMKTFLRRSCNVNKSEISQGGIKMRRLNPSLRNVRI
jgi:hypothetical protein